MTDQYVLASLGGDYTYDWLTDGKVYKIERYHGEGCFDIIDDEGDLITCRFGSPAHIGQGGCWTRVQSPELPAKPDVLRRPRRKLNM